MTNSNSEERLLDELLSEITKEEQIDNINAGIIAWCKRLNIEEDTSCYIQTWVGKLLGKSVASCNWITDGSYLTIFGFGRENKSLHFKWRDVEIDFKPSKETQYNMRSILLIAFCLLAIGYLLSQLPSIKKSKTESRSTQDRKPSTAASTPASTSTAPSPLKTYTLLLVIAPEQINIWYQMQQYNKIQSSEQGEDLYNATRFLKMEEDKTSEQTHTRKDLFARNAVKHGPEESEYDVYVITVKLNSYDRGFDRSASSIERLDAFKRLHEISQQVEISSKLSNRIYENLNVYSR